MNHLLSVNAGSTSVKYKLFDENLNEVLFGHIEIIKGKFTSKLIKLAQRYEWEISPEQFKNPHLLIQKELKDYQINKIGFRIVHGGEKYTKPTLLTDSVVSELQKLNDMAPLHNPPAIKIIKQFKKIYPEIKMYGVFDTAFHSTIKPEQYLYSLPFEMYKLHKIRKYGFHGISHEYIYEQVKQLEKKHSKIISCHLGGGASITAIKDGKSFDTSMGFTPMEGLTMATRSGDIDSGIIFYLTERKLYPMKELKKLMNHYSGLMGVSGITSDMRKLLDLEKRGNKRAHIAIEIYLYDIVRYIGAYIIALGGLDILVFSGGVGSGSDVLRERIIQMLSAYKIRLSKKNKGKINVEENMKISSRGSIPVWIIPTDEERMIAKTISKPFES